MIGFGFCLICRSIVTSRLFLGRDMLRGTRRCYRASTARRRAFTLVELLVVMSLIALLMAILMPSLRCAREQARQTVCAHRLKQWGNAFACYASDNAGALPHCDGLDRNPPPLDNANASSEDLADWHGWVDLLPPLVGAKPWRDHDSYAFPREGTFYHCPTARLIDPVSEYGYYPRKDGYFSYAMNACLELDANAWRPPDGLDWPMPSFLRCERIVTPQRVILLFEQLLDPKKGYGGRYRCRSAGEHCGSYPIAFSARHPRARSMLGGNILYADSHAGWQKTVWKPDWNDWNIGRQQGPARGDLDWYPYPPPDDRDG